MHIVSSPFKNKTVVIKKEVKDFGGHKYEVEDWWDIIAKKSWMNCDGNPACLAYAMRSAFADLPTDNEVLYGHIGMFGYLIHISEIEEEIKND